MDDIEDGVVECVGAIGDAISHGPRSPWGPLPWLPWLPVFAL